MVTGTTASSGDHSIMTGRRVSPVASWTRRCQEFGVARFGKARSVEHVLGDRIGDDGRGVAGQDVADRAADRRNRRRRARPSGRPGSAVTAISRPTTGNADANASIAEAGVTVRDRSVEAERGGTAAQKFSSATM